MWDMFTRSFVGPIPIYISPNDPPPIRRVILYLLLTNAEFILNIRYRLINMYELTVYTRIESKNTKYFDISAVVSDL